MKKTYFFAIQDNGIGFNLNEVSNESLGMKLLNIHARQLKAKLSISTNNKGTKVELIIPKQKK